MGGHFIHDNQNIYHNPVSGAQSSGFQQLATIDWSTKPSVIEGALSYQFSFFYLVFLLSYHFSFFNLVFTLLFFFLVNFLLLYMYFFGKLFWGNIFKWEYFYLIHFYVFYGKYILWSYFSQWTAQVKNMYIVKR